MPECIQYIYLVMWEPTDPRSTAAVEFRWSRCSEEIDEWPARLRDDRRQELTIYSATLPLPTDGDFADDEHLEESLRHILQSWPRNQCPPLDQTLSGRVDFSGATPTLRL